MKGKAAAAGAKIRSIDLEFEMACAWVDTDLVNGKITPGHHSRAITYLEKQYAPAFTAPCEIIVASEFTGVPRVNISFNGLFGSGDDGA